MQDIIIVESPNKVRDVQAYAAAAGFDVKVHATSGHLLDLPPMKLGTAIDPDSFTPTAVVPRDDAAAARVSRLQRAIAGAARVIVATDADREGEAIAAQVWPWIPTGKARRTAFEEITPSGIRSGLAALRPTMDQHRAEAALCRRVVDRLAGWHATDTVFAKLRHLKGVSAGRLQSAALRLVVDRHQEHQAFKPTTTWGLRAIMRSSTGAEFPAILGDKDGTAVTFPTRQEAEAVNPPPEAKIASLTTRRITQKPRPPFEASSWLQVAQKALGLSVRDATSATQGMFEAGFTTYPRTDTVRVAPEAIEWARTEIRRRFGDAYLPPSRWDHKDRYGSQGAHEAIRPTIPHAPDDLDRRHNSPEWSAAYSLVEARFLASQAAARVVDITTVRITAAPERWFHAQGHSEIFDGWRRVLKTDAAEEDDSRTANNGKNSAEHRSPADTSAPLPPLVEGETVQIISLEPYPRTTKPKPLFTQASLIAELRRLGIGRPSTYQTIVPLLLSRAWVLEESASPPKKAEGKKTTGAKRAPKVLVPTDVGVTLCRFLEKAFPSLVDYAFTASLEAELDDIEGGRRVRVETCRTWWARFAAELDTARALPAEQPQRPDLGPCPKCATEGRPGRLRLLKGTSSKTGLPYEFAACDTDSREARVCGYTAQTHEGKLHDQTPCPRCTLAMRAVRRKDGGHSWVCNEHGWYLATRDWKLVKAPSCPKCGSPLIHRERSDSKGEFFWACFQDRVFQDADVFGRPIRKRARAS